MSDQPKSPSEFVETMLRSALEADRLVSENINDRWLREAHTHTAINGFVAAMAMEYLRHVDSDTADHVAEELEAVFTRGDLAGPLYRIAKKLGHDPDQWIEKYEERAASRKAKAA